MTELLHGAEVSALVHEILLRRGYDNDQSLDKFLFPSYDQDLGDPYLLTDMEPAVARIIQATRAHEPIAIYGDYDIDGLTATSLLLDLLGGLGANVIGYIPDRFEEGYGINQTALTKLKKAGIKLVISVDCGITSVSEAAWAKKHHLDLIITDHHAVPEQIPEAIAVINPKRPGDKYPFKDLAGVGVAFKLAQAVQQRLGKPAAGQEKWLLDLVALGTVCDVVTLVGENRVLVTYGLKVLAQTKRVGIRALADVAGVNLADVSSYHLGFLLGPRLNAAGRLETATEALRLLTTGDPEEATVAAAHLNQLNQDRRDQQAIILTQAIAAAEPYQNDPVLVLASPDWAQGIVGIVASKLVERYHKPTLLLQILGDTAKGSGRSVSSFNLVENLRALDGIFLKVGGHHFAAGFTLETPKIDALRQGLIKRANDGDAIQAYVPSSDLELEDFTHLSLELIGALEKLEPFGNGNPKPTMAATKIKIMKAGTVGADGKHLKLILADKLGQTITALGFSLAEQHPNLAVGQEIDVWFQLVKNDFNGYAKPEIILSQIH